MKTLKCAVLILFVMGAMETRAQEAADGKVKPKTSRIKSKRPVKRAAAERITPAEQVSPDKKTDSKEEVKPDTKMKTVRKPVKKTATPGK